MINRKLREYQSNTRTILPLYELVELIDFVTDRFYGQSLDEQQVVNAIGDWARKAIIEKDKSLTTK